MVSLMIFDKIKASIAQKAILNGGISLIIVLLIISITCFVLYFLIDNDEK